jgi:hypothetical protein
VSPAGGYAASLILNGTGGTPKTAFYRHDKSYVALLKIDGTQAAWQRRRPPTLAARRLLLTEDRSDPNPR